MSPPTERKLRAASEYGDVFASQAFGASLGTGPDAALCARGTNCPEAERSNGSAVALAVGD